MILGRDKCYPQGENDKQNRKVKIVLETSLINVAQKVGIMKRAMAILIMIVAAASLLQAAAASSKSDYTSILGPVGSVFFTPGTDTKKVEDRMQEALTRLDSWKRAREQEKKEPLVSKAEQAEMSESLSLNSTLNNSASGNSTSFNSPSSNLTHNNISINSSLVNSSLLNSPTAQVADANEDRQNVGSSIRGSPNGYYGMTASRHEIGKSGINSRTFLSGNFEMDKTVKFQDQGID